MKLPRLKWYEWSAIALAIAVRVAAVLSFLQTDYAAHPLVDAYTYWGQAGDLFEGKDPFAEGLYQPPGYPYFLAQLAHLTGRPELAAVRWAQASLGVISSLLLMGLGRSLGSRVGVPWAGAVAVVLFSLYPTTLLFELDILTPALTTALFLGAVATSWWGKRAILGVISGVLLGLAVVCHPTYLLAAVVLGGWVFTESRLRGVLLIAGLAATLAPTTAKNLRDFDKLALVSHNAGINLYLGNNPGWRQTAFLRPGLPFRKLALEADPASRDVSQRDAYWRQRTVDEITDHPDAWAAALVTKAYWSVHNTEVPRNEDYRCRIEADPITWLGWLPVRYGLVFPLALIGLVSIRRRGEGRLLAGLWLTLHVPLIIFLVSDRYRLATWPVLCLLAPLGMAAVGAVVSKWRQGTRPGLGWLLVLPVVVLPWLPTDPIIEKDPGWCLHVQGNLAYMEKRLDEAMELYEASIALDADNISAWNYIAALHHRARRYPEAAAAMQHVINEFPDHFPSLRFMSQIQESLGDRVTAAMFMGRAYRVPGERTSSGIRYVKMLVAAGQVEEARAVLAADPELAGHPKLEGAVPD
ncbi:MAG: tetratricopeptide (TPR) repeat protein [Myxococcota bacterium]|jgi:tetratricopeptide (TPR) repeat protein